MSITPTSDKPASEDSLFHYITAAGLHGIISSNTIWSTASYCSNKDSELRHCTGALSDMVNAELRELKYALDERLTPINSESQSSQLVGLGTRLEKQISKTFTSNYELSITSFCKHEKAPCVDGLFSRWHRYGPDGAYAIAFDRTKLKELVCKANQQCSKAYELADDNYSKNKSAPKESSTELEAAMRIDSLSAPNFKPPPNLHPEDTKALVSIVLDVLTDRSQRSLDLTADQRISDWIGAKVRKHISYFAFQKSDGFAEEKEMRLTLPSPKNQDAQKKGRSPNSSIDPEC